MDLFIVFPSKNERLFSIKPLFIERWRYIDGVPFVEIYLMVKKEYIQKSTKRNRQKVRDEKL